MVALTAERKAGGRRARRQVRAVGAPPPGPAPAGARHGPRRRRERSGRSRRRGHHRGGVRQGRGRQVDHRGQSRARACVDSACRVGILDADIYGPSLPKLLAIKERPQTLGGTRLKPITRYGLTVMSIGFLIDEETPMIWRGPMVISALTQMLREVEWGDARRPGRRHAARHRRCPAHHGAAGAAQGRGHRLHAAGPRADRCAARHRHVQAGQRAGARRRSRT